MEPIYWLKASAILSIIWVIYIALLRSDTYFQVKRFYLLSGVLLSFLLPFWHIYKVVQVSFANGVAFPTTNIPSYEAKQAFNWFTISNLFWFMALVSGILLLKIMFDLWSLFLLIQSGKKEPHDDFVLVTVTKDVSPFSFGKYVVINPENFTDDEYKMILRHELVHIKQKHWVDLLFANIITALQWYNPVAWLYRKAIDENLEFIADAQAQSTIQNPIDYQYLILKTGSRQVAPVLSTSFYKSNLKKRIIMLQKNQTKRIKMLKISVLLPLLTLFLYSFNTVEITQNTQVKTFYIDKTTPKSEVKKIEKEINAFCKEMSISINNVKYKNGIINSIRIKLIDKDGTESHEASFNANKGIAKITLLVSEEKIQINPQNSIYEKPDFNANSLKDIQEISAKNIQDGKTSGFIKFKDKTIYYLHNQNGIFYYDKFGNLLDEETTAQINKKLNINSTASLKANYANKIYYNDKVYYYNIKGGDNNIDIRDKFGNMVDNRIREKITKQIFDRAPPIYVINGKIVSIKEFNSINQDKIKRIHVLKGKLAVKKYGNKAISGAVEVTLKK